MFHDNESQLVVNLDYQLNTKEIPFMITKTLFVRCTLSNVTKVYAVCNIIKCIILML